MHTNHNHLQNTRGNTSLVSLHPKARFIVIKIVSVIRLLATADKRASNIEVTGLLINRLQRNEAHDPLQLSSLVARNNYCQGGAEVEPL